MSAYKGKKKKGTIVIFFFILLIIIGILGYQLIKSSEQKGMADMASFRDGKSNDDKTNVHTLFQTSRVVYDPRIDLRTDGILVHEHGSSLDQIGKSTLQWQNNYNDVSLMWFIGSDAGRHYTEGRIDGQKHPDEIEIARDQGQFAVGDPGNHRPYMVPTVGWNEYMTEIAKKGVDSGVTGIAPEEPLAHTLAGYSEAFQREWELFYDEPWSPPHSSIQTFWNASKLKSYLYYRTVETVLQNAKQRAAEQGQELQFRLPIHSLISHTAGNMIYPNGQTFYMDGLDGFIGQVWTGPIGWSVGKYEGTQLTRDNGFFDSAWLLYSSFANLVKGSDKSMYLLADPVEDDPNYQWDEYHLWYNQSLVSKLMFPWINQYEVMPWPDRIFLPGHSTGGGSPGPASYRTQLMINIAALTDMQNQEEVIWQGGTEGIGVLISDTMTWQRGGPSGSSLDSFHGLTLPLLRNGIPVQILPIERIVDQGYLDEYKVLLVSYDMWKPLDPAYHQSLAEWINQGGTLLFFEGNDPFNEVDEWWSQEGYNAPVEHLMEELDLDAKIEVNNDGSQESEWSTVLESEHYTGLENLDRHSVDLTSFLPADYLLIRFRDGSPEDGWGPFLKELEMEINLNDGTEKIIQFTANNDSEEQEYLWEVVQPGGVDETRRYADMTGSYSYLLPVKNATNAQLHVQLGNHFVVEVKSVIGDLSHVEGELEEQVDEVLLPTLTELLQESTEDISLVSKRTPIHFRNDSDESKLGFVHSYGQGQLIYLGIPSATFANSEVANETLRGLVSFAVEDLSEGVYQESGYMLLQRGKYAIAHGLEGSVSLEGTYVDLLNHTLPILQDPEVGAGESALLYDVSALLANEQPSVLYASHELIDAFIDQGNNYMLSAGPLDTPGVIRFSAGTANNSSPSNIEAYSLKENGPKLLEEVDREELVEALERGDLQVVDVDWEWQEDSQTVWVQFDQRHSGVIIVAEW